MNKFRAALYIFLFIFGLVLLVYFISNLINSHLDQTANPNIQSNQAQIADNTSAEKPATPDVNATPAPEATQTTDNTAAPVEVTTIKLASVQNSFYPAIGTVKSTQIVSLFPQVSAAVKKINFKEGQFVDEGQTIIELTGNNLTEHPTETQLKIAEQTLANAQSAYQSLQKTSEESLKTAALQLQSAVNQASAISYDLAVIEQNKAGLQDSLNILQDSLLNTEQKNTRDDLKGKNDIDHLIATLNQAQSDRGQTQKQIDDLQAQIDALKNQPNQGLMSVTPTGNVPVDLSGSKTSTTSGQTPTTQVTDPTAALQAQLDKLKTALTSQDKGISDLYDAIYKAKYGLNTAENAAAIGANTIDAQIANAQSQSRVLDLNLQSTKTKLGYTGDSSDALQLAQQAYNSTKVQLQTALDNSANQVKLAQLSLDLAKNSASGLQIKAPFSGVITSLDLSPGQSVNAQTAVIEMINPQGFELEVGLDPAVADRLDPITKAKITLAGHTIEVPFKSIAPKIDDKTKLVNVTLVLPNIFFKINQTLKVELPLSNADAGKNAFYLPLDSVIIGSETQFVYVDDNGKAKKVPVKIGEISGDQIAILAGLEPDAEVILSGAKNLTEGQPITVTNNQ